MNDLLIDACPPPPPPIHAHAHTHTHHPWPCCNTALQQFRKAALCQREQFADWKTVTLFHFCHPPCKWLYLRSFLLSHGFWHSGSHNRISLPPRVPWAVPRKRTMGGRGGKKQTKTNALKWKMWSFHLPPLLFARLLPQSRSAGKQMFSQTWRRGASVLMGMALPPLSLLMHRHDSCLISWSC